METLLEMQRLFREVADIIDEIIEVDKGTDEKRKEEVQGRFIIKLLELQALEDK